MPVFSAARAGNVTYYIHIPLWCCRFWEAGTKATLPTCWRTSRSSVCSIDTAKIGDSWTRQVGALQVLVACRMSGSLICGSPYNNLVAWGNWASSFWQPWQYEHVWDSRSEMWPIFKPSSWLTPLKPTKLFRHPVLSNGKFLQLNHQVLRKGCQQGCPGNEKQKQKPTHFSQLSTCKSFRKKLLSPLRFIRENLQHTVLVQYAHFWANTQYTLCNMLTFEQGLFL